MQPEQYGYWRSLAELNKTPEFQEAQRKEFLSGPNEDFSSATRRRFLQLSAASATLAAVAGCRVESRLAPYRVRPEEAVPGEPMFFATSMELGGVGYPLMVKSFDYRPIKVDGNPNHPFSQVAPGNWLANRSRGRDGLPRTGYGASSNYAQAAILELYDPDRLQLPSFRGREGFESRQAAWAQFGKWVGEHLSGDGQGVAVLTEPSNSPTVTRMRRAFTERYPQARWIEYGPLASNGTEAGLQLAFGAKYRPDYNFTEAKIIALFDADPFGDHPANIPYSRQLAQVRDPERLKGDGGWITRVYAAEGVYSKSGANADHRLPCQSKDIRNLLLALEAELDSGTSRQGGDPKSYIADEGAQKFIHVLAEDLKANAGAAVVVVGDRQPADVIALAHSLNAKLESVGKTVRYLEPKAADGGEAIEQPGNFEGIQSLVEQMQAGGIQTLLVFGGNPVYDAPSDLKFGEAINKVANTAHLTLYANETSLACQWQLPLAHWLESWGDSLTWDGSLLLQQPLIDPLYEGRTVPQVTEMLLGRPGTSARALTQATFAQLRGLGSADGGTLDREYRKAIHDGFVPETAWTPASPMLAQFDVAAGDAPVSFPSKDDKKPGDESDPKLEVNFVGCGKLYDGRFANNAWLQEVPDFLTSLTWDNAALMSPATAVRLGVSEQSMITLDFGNDRKLEVAACILPGQGPNTITLWLGYGREHVGRVGGDVDNDVDLVGFDTYKVRTLGSPWIVDNVTVSMAPGTVYKLARTQDHFALDPFARKEVDVRVERIIRTGTTKDFAEHPDFAQHMIHVPQMPDGSGPARLWENWEYDGHKWGMATDLNKCTGCNACVVACQAENNIPTVGKEQVINGREMHWLRIDRYFYGDPENPGVAGQPLLCQQCETAPCEQVCPVGATLHSHEGLNDMVYNRCIGTRYCSNNCPYKVRRFNYFYYHFDADEHEIKQFAFNPQVTVRSRGVMEKCTFCVQRIQQVKIEAKTNRRPIADGEIITACQQACPSQAIVFGDLNYVGPQGEKSQVAKLHESKRSYALLEELMTLPRNLFLARVVNPNPELGPATLVKAAHGGHGHGEEHGHDEGHDHEHDHDHDHDHEHDHDHDEAAGSAAFLNPRGPNLVQLSWKPRGV